MIFPRLAIGTVQYGRQPEGTSWALLAFFEQMGRQVQSFRSTSTLTPREGILRLTGREQRHLDSWLMSERTCRQLFQWNMRDADLGLIEGPYDCARSAGWTGGSLDRLCEWLDVPRLVVIRVDDTDPCQLRRPNMPIDALLIEGFTTDHEFARWATTLESCWNAPVVGGLPLTTRLQVVRRMLARGDQPSVELCRHLAADLGQRLRRDRLEQLAARPYTAAVGRPRPDLAEALGGVRGVHIAMALDESFQCYFPDALDALESCGASIRTFSPLRSPALPPDTDLVYLGCGRLDRYAELLAANHCLKQELQRFAARGGHIYGECAGLAYLCRQVVIDGTRHAMVGALPAVATWTGDAAEPIPATMKLGHASWLGKALDEIQGYVNPCWEISTWDHRADLALAPEHRGWIFHWHNVIAGRLHLNLAASADFPRRFLTPTRPSSFIT